MGGLQTLCDHSASVNMKASPEFQLNSAHELRYVIAYYILKLRLWIEKKKQGFISKLYHRRISGAATNDLYKKYYKMRHSSLTTPWANAL